jgi:threonine synthase
MLELFHGPTAAFKDAGARFLARALARLADGPRTIVVATSGDTGGAVASAFHGLAGMNVAVLFPEKGVSPFQRKQLTCWGGNVRAFAVAGTFDDCQRMVKAALASGERARRLGLTSANSISVGRLLPQIAFYAAASLWQAARSQGPLQVVVPTGNLGNGVAALYARAMGYPIEKIALASNANRPVPDYLASGRWNPRPSQSTLANAMDVGDPSNGARLTALEPDRAKLSAYVTADSATDDEIRAEVRSAWREWNVAICPHTAAGLHLWRKLGWGTSAVVAATAHPSKFHESLEAEGVPVHWPATLRAIREKPTHEEKLSADPEKLLKELEG